MAVSRRRIPDKATLSEEVAAWEAERNKKHTKADWQFTTADARVKQSGCIRQYEHTRRSFMPGASSMSATFADEAGKAQGGACSGPQASK